MLKEETVSAASRKEEGTLKQSLDEILERENEMWKQRSKLQWAQEGDRNTRFFHNRASQRLSRNEIQGLKDNQGILQTSPESMGDIVVSYFQNIFSRFIHQILILRQPWNIYHLR